MIGEVLVVQHAEPETLGGIAEALCAHHLQPRYVRPFKGEAIARTIGRAVALILMGGPMGVYENRRFPFLRDEMMLIEDTLTKTTADSRRVSREPIACCRPRR